MLRSATETVYVNVIEDVISKTRYSRVCTGELEESIPNEFQKIWEGKMIKAGIISRPIPLPTPTPLETHIPTHLNGNAVESSIDMNVQFPKTPLETQNPTYLHGSAGNPYLADRSTDISIQFSRMNPYTTPLETQIPNYLHGSAGNPYLTDRSTDINVQFPRLNPYTDLVAFRKIKRDGFHIPQQDGGGTGVGDGLNVSVNIEKNKGVCKEYEPLNEGDDNKEEDIEKDTPRHVLAQFDMVKCSKNHWKCILKSGIMLLNDKDLLFSEATGEFKL